MRLVRVMCSGRVDSSFVLRALSKGADGVFIGACHLNECNYITNGNFQALSMVSILRKIMQHVGLSPERLRIGFVSGSEAGLYTEHVSSFIEKIKELGPIGKGEGLSEEALQLKLSTITSLIPYIRLVERERLRITLKTEEEIESFFASDEVNGLFEDLFAGNLTIGQIMQLLRQGPRTTAEISETLGISPSEVARRLNTSSRHGLVRYDVDCKRFVAA